MLQIIAKIPLFVWPLFILLLWAGLRARKSNPVPLIVLIAMPTFFFTWSLFSFLGNYGHDLTAILLWILCLGIGFAVGFAHMQSLELRFDKYKVEMEGSWIPLMLSMSIFTSKFSVGMLRALRPDLSESLGLLGLELFAILIVGIFGGRGIGCMVRYAQFASK